MKIKALFLICGIVLMFLFPLYSQDYSLDYGISGISGIIWESSDYKIVDFVSDPGLSQNLQFSLDYSVAPVIGLEDVTSSVSDWMLY